jgi:hypothetical protein
VSSSKIAIDPFSDDYPSQSIWLAILIGILIGLNNIVIGFKFMGVSYDRIAEISLFLILLPRMIRHLKYSGVFRAMVLVLIFFGVLRQITEITLWMQGEDSNVEAFTRTFVKSATYLIYFVLAYEGMRLSLMWFLRAYLFIVFLAGLMAFFQSPLTPLTTEAWNAKVTYFGANLQNESFLNTQKENAEVNENRFGIRVAGPYQYSIAYSYALFVPFALTIYLLFARGRISNLALFLFFGVLVLFTLTRSLLLAAIILLIPLLFRVSFLQSIGLGIVGIGAFIYFEIWRYVEIFLSTRLSNLTSDIEVRRDLLALCGFEAVIRNPFGVTKDAYKAIQREYFEEYGATTLLFLPSHNGFVNMGFHFGVLGYFVFMLWLSICLWFYRRVRKQVRIFFPFALLAYIAHGSFHNAFIFTGDYHPLIILGLFTFEAQLGALSKKQQQEHEAHH